jgi:hypothetical protein
MPRKMARLYRRLRSAAERLPLVWRLRHYPYAYMDAGNDWRAMSRAQRWWLIAGITEQELLLSHHPYPVD